MRPTSGPAASSTLPAAFRIVPTILSPCASALSSSPPVTFPVSVFRSPSGSVGAASIRSFMEVALPITLADIVQRQDDEG
jgi:hypothetical protein